MRGPLLPSCEKRFTARDRRVRRVRREHPKRFLEKFFVRARLRKLDFLCVLSLVFSAVSAVKGSLHFADYERFQEIRLRALPQSRQSFPRARLEDLVEHARNQSAIVIGEQLQRGPDEC